MNLKDLMLITAPAITIITFIIVMIQRKRDMYRTIRKDLTSTLDNIEAAKHRQINDNSKTVFDLIPEYEIERKALIAHADSLISKYEKIATDTDYNILASALTNIGDLDKARTYWKKAIDKSEDNARLHINLRGYGKFLFLQGQIQLARNTYNEALILDLPDNDYYRRLMTETCIVWAKVEKKLGNSSGFKQVIGLAKELCARIGNKEMRDEMTKQINMLESSE